MDYSYISSRQNETVKLFASLATKKGRADSGLYIAEGFKLCREALGNCTVRYAVISEASLKKPDFAELCERSGGEIVALSQSAYEKISGDTAPDGIAFVCKIEDSNDVVTDGKTFILEAVRDPGNVGTAIRSAAAFGYDSVVLCGCADRYNPKVLRASMGAAFKINISQTESIVPVAEHLHGEGRRIIAATLSENSLVCGRDDLLESDCIVVGNEGHGVSEDTLRLCDEAVIIPMTDKTESLNAAVAATVLMWQYGRH